MNCQTVPPKKILKMGKTPSPSGCWATSMVFSDAFLQHPLLTTVNFSTNVARLSEQPTHRTGCLQSYWIRSALSLQCTKINPIICMIYDIIYQDQLHCIAMARQYLQYTH